MNRKVSKRRCGNGWIVLAVVLYMAAGWSCWAQDAETNRTVVTSDRLEYDYRNRGATFTGNVEVRHPRMRIKSQQLTVVFGPANNIRSLTAVKDVRIWESDKVATCRKAIFLSQEQEVVLVGDATVRRARDVLRGDVITFIIGEDRLTSQPGHLEIAPRREREEGE